MTNNSYDDGINSGNRWVLIFFAMIVVFLASMIYVSATSIETKGGVYNGDMEYGTGSATILSYIGDENYGWSLRVSAGSTGSASYDTTTKHSGNQSMKLQQFTGTGAFYVRSSAYNGGFNSGTQSKLISIKPNTNYKLSYWYKTEVDSAVTGFNGIIYLSTLDYSVRSILSGSYSTISEDWSFREYTFTSNSTEVYADIGFVINNADMNAWIDDIRLEEVDTLSLSTQQQGRPSITITGVTDTNAIDQSQTTGNLNYYIGDSGGTDYNLAQSFIPTQNKFVSFDINKQTTLGTPTGNLIFELRTGTSAIYSSTILASSTYTPAQWNALSNGINKITLPAIVDANTTNVYWVTSRNSVTTEANNNAYVLSANSAGGYTSGTLLQNNVNTSDDLDFRTTFAKLSSSVDLNVVAPDGTSELKSYDVNGDILTDANITINPDGTGKYYYYSGLLGLANLTNTYKFSNNVFDANYGQETYWTTKIINNWGVNNNNAITTAKGTNHYITLNPKMPVDCTVNSLYLNVLGYGSTSTADHNLQVSVNNSTWTNLASTQGGVAETFEVNATTNLLDGNNNFYLRYFCGGNDYCQIRGVVIDANLSCPTLTTPLFKNGTNTLYTMNKDANQQAGATLTPSLMSNLTFNFNAPTTTFSSFQVPNTTDQNITLTCTDPIAGCKTIEYNINNSGWNSKIINKETNTTHNTNYQMTSTAYVLKSTIYLDRNTPLKNKLTNMTMQLIRNPTGGTCYAKYNIVYTDGTSEYTNEISSTSLAPNLVSFTIPSSTKDVNHVETYAKYGSYSCSLYDQTITYRQIRDVNYYNFLYSTTGLNTIQYYSTDNSDNNETIKTSLFSTYGNARFTIKDQNSGLDLNGTQINFNGSDYVSGSNIYDFNLQELTGTNTPYLFTISKSGYSTRYYQTDLNYYSTLDINFALIPNTLDFNVPFKVYQTDETTLFTNTYVELKDSDTNWTIGKLKTDADGEATFNLRADDSNYNILVNNGQFTYTPVAVTILYPKNEETLATITENWKIEITQNLFALYTDLNASKIIYLLPNTSLPYNIKISDMNGNYFPRTYTKIYPGNPLTATLQPYLVSTITGLLTTLNTIDATTLTPVPTITIMIYKNISGLGRTLVETIVTDTKGQALVLLVLNSTYEFEIYQSGTYLRTDPITATSSSIDIKIPSSATQNTDFNYYLVNVSCIPNRGKLLTTDTNLNQVIKIVNAGTNAVTITQILIWLQNQDNDYNFFDDPIPITGSTTTNNFDVNTIAKTINGISYDKNTFFYANVRVTTSDGNVYVKSCRYGLPGQYSITEGLGPGLKATFGCTASSDTLFPCPVMLLAALFISLIGTIGLASMTGYASMESMAVVFLAFLGIFVYLTWVPGLLYGLMILLTVVLGISMGGNRI